MTSVSKFIKKGGLRYTAATILLLLLITTWMKNNQHLPMAFNLAWPFIWLILEPFEKGGKITHIIANNKLRYILAVVLMFVGVIIDLQRAYGIAMGFIPLVFLVDFVLPVKKVKQ